MPAWDDLPPPIQIAWAAAVRQVAVYTESPDAASSAEGRWAGCAPMLQRLHRAPAIHRIKLFDYRGSRRHPTRFTLRQTISSPSNLKPVAPRTPGRRRLRVV